mmetsp:Transcript_3323/g.9266  ORF Transcript_3323/g.9266 Transcript_3323/m.9266 type:complete len:609 (-) Transcript_3323:221-2047(-)
MSLLVVSTRKRSFVTGLVPIQCHAVEVGRQGDFACEVDRAAQQGAPKHMRHCLLVNWLVLDDLQERNDVLSVLIRIVHPRGVDSVQGDETEPAPVAAVEVADDSGCDLIRVHDHVEQNVSCRSLHGRVVGILALKQLDDWTVDPLDVVLLHDSLQRLEAILNVPGHAGIHLSLLLLHAGPGSSSLLVKFALVLPQQLALLLEIPFGLAELLECAKNVVLLFLLGFYVLPLPPDRLLLLRGCLGDLLVLRLEGCQARFLLLKSRVYLLDLVVDPVVPLLLGVELVLPALLLVKLLQPLLRLHDVGLLLLFLRHVALQVTLLGLQLLLGAHDVFRQVRQLVSERLVGGNRVLPRGLELLQLQRDRGLLLGLLQLLGRELLLLPLELVHLCADPRLLLLGLLAVHLCATRLLIRRVALGHDHLPLLLYLLKRSVRGLQVPVEDGVLHHPPLLVEVQVVHQLLLVPLEFGDLVLEEVEHVFDLLLLRARVLHEVEGLLPPLLVDLRPSDLLQELQPGLVRHHREVSDLPLLHDVVGVGAGEPRALQQVHHLRLRHMLPLQAVLVLLERDGPPQPHLRALHRDPPVRVVQNELYIRGARTVPDPLVQKPPPLL